MFLEHKNHKLITKILESESENKIEKNIKDQNHIPTFVLVNASEQGTHNEIDFPNYKRVKFKNADAAFMAGKAARFER